MSCCFEPGQVVILPSPVLVGTDGLKRLLPDSGISRIEVLHSVEDVLQHYQLKLPKGFPSFPVLLRVPIGEEHKSAERLRTFSDIDVAVPNYYIRPSLAGAIPNDVYISDSLRECGLWSAQRVCGKGVTVAVLDTGVSLSVFDDIPPPIQFDTDVPRRAETGLSPSDPCGHGTIVTTVIRRGAPGATILPIKVMGCSGNLMGAIAGIYTAIAAGRPQIFNLSLSLTCDPDLCRWCHQPLADSPVTLDQLSLLFQQVDNIYDYNGFPKPLLVAAAGNVEKDSPLTVPACLQNVLAVGAYDSPLHPERPSEYAQYDEDRIPVERFVRAPGGIDTRDTCFGVLEPAEDLGWNPELFYGTSFATALATAVAARYLCATQGSPCGVDMRQGGADRSFLLQCVKAGANRGFKGFDSSVHGLGLVRYELDVVSHLLGSAR